MSAMSTGGLPEQVNRHLRDQHPDRHTAVTRPGKEGFHIYADRAHDADTLVVVELVTDEVTISEPASVALYLREFDHLRAGAAYDEAAHALIDHIIADLQTERT